MFQYEDAKQLPRGANNPPHATGVPQLLSYVGVHDVQCVALSLHHSWGRVWLLLVWLASGDGC